MSETETERETKIGHNSNLTDAEKKKLEGYISEIEELEEKSSELSSDRGNIYKSAKKDGFDTKALKEVIKLRRMRADSREAWQNAVDAYMNALGPLSDTGLGRAAVARDLGANPQH